ncbi:hypothetical protein LY632_03425 [Erythrobacter sp. SDW2]|uniref:hypothetical protein n=1 Tax=Erythrobacter sp. SDW2 TaxID=2907154 RepID=UPI001F26988D|nr:hypothetical protein [Erythrobacter sp. SDW2]UIP07461.1 hypothetical protein LY632_03425 [Erythrobacter sp. SDW2]
MRRALALGLTTLAGFAGAVLLGPQAVPASAATAALAPYNAALQLAAARAALRDEAPTARQTSALFAKRALYAMPLGQPALALAAENGAIADPTAALNLGAALGWRDQITNARLAALALENGETEIAAQRIDALGRTRGGGPASAAANLILKTPGGSEAMAARASKGAGALWWIVSLRQPTDDLAVLAGRVAMARALDKDAGPWRSDLLAATAQGIALSEIPGPEKDRLRAAMKVIQP